MKHYTRYRPLVILRKSTPWIVFACLWVIVSGSALADKPIRVSLKSCIERALQYNKELQTKDIDIDLAREKQNEVRSVGFPVVEYEYILAPAPKDLNNATQSFFSGDVSVLNKFHVGVGTPLTTFGKLQNGKALAGQGIEAEIKRKAQKENDVIFQVNQLYYGILLSHEISRLLKSAGDKLQEEINKREEDTGYDPSELLKMKILNFEIQKREQEAEMKRDLAVNALKGLLGYEHEGTLELSEDKLRPRNYVLKEFETLKKEGFENRPEVQLLDVGVKAREYQLNLEESNGWPNLNIGGFFDTGYAPDVSGITATDDFNDPFNYARAGLGLQLKGSFDFHKHFSKTAQARGELKKMEIQRELGRMGLELDLKQAYLDLQSQKAAIERADEAGRLSRQLLFLTQSNFDLGLAESKDLVDAVQSFLTSRGDYFETVYNYNVACAKLDTKLGRRE